MAVSTSNAKPFSNGHYYAYSPDNVSFGTAYDYSTASYLNQLGVYGYLATVTSSGENSFIASYSKGGGAITSGAFIAGTDYDSNNGNDLDMPYSNSEGIWMWQAGPEGGQTFRSGGATPSGMYANWNSGEPNNSNNEDFLAMYTSGYWNDTDPDAVGGYITEWGRSGAEFTVSLNSGATVNAFEGGTSGSVVVHLDRPVYGDYSYNSVALIDIPIALGGAAVYNTDYTISVSGGASSYSYTNGKLYLLGASGSSIQDVTLSIVPVNNSAWEKPCDVTITLGADGSENIYSLGSTTTQQFLIVDDEPTLSLGQGLKQSLYNRFDGTTASSLPSTETTVLFDTDGIDETDTTFSNIGLNDTFGMRWEGYVRIPQTGSYQFRTTSDDGVKLILKSNNANGTTLASLGNWTLHGSTADTTTALSLSAGDVVWLQMDYFEAAGGAIAKLEWLRTPTGGSAVTEVIPASALFLSEAVARGRNPVEPSSGEQTGTAFTVFASKSSSALSVGLGFSSSSGTTTIGTSSAQRRTSSNSVVGDDYGIYSDSGANTLQTSSLSWTPNSPNSTTGLNQTDLYYRVFSDLYAEGNETMQLTLQSGTGYGVASDTMTDTIIDQPLTLSIEAVQNPGEGEAGWVTIRSRVNGSFTNNPFAGGLPVKYQITGGSATRGTDYLAPQATLSTTSFLAEDLVYLPPNTSETRLYISALADAIREGDETITLQILPRTETNSSGFTYQRYLVDSSRSTASLTLGDSSRNSFAIASANPFGLTAGGSGLAHPAFVDIDNDSDKDIFISYADGSTLFFRNTGSASAASFAGSAASFGLQADVGDRASIAFADIDNDADFDAFIGNFDGSTLFFRNTGSRSAAAFAGSSISFALPDVGQNASPSFADIDADGDLDAFIGNFDGNTLFFRNTGSRSAAAFSGSSIAFGFPDVGYVAKPAIADIDGDGDLDVFLGNYDGSTLYFRNTGSSSAPAFATSSLSFSLTDVGQFASPSFADIDADSDLDAFIGNGDGNTLFQRNVPWRAGVAITPPDRTGSATIRASVNGNGQQQASVDVHLLSQPRADVTVALSSTSGTLSASTLTFTAANWSSPQRVTLSNLSSSATTSLTASTSTSSSSDSFYATALTAVQTIVPSSWSSDLGLTLWEGGTEQAAKPLVSLTPVDGEEGGSNPLGVDVVLDSPQVDSALEVFYTLSAGSGFQLSGGTADVEAAPDRTYKPLTLTSGSNAYANLGSFSTVASNGAFSAEAWVRADATNTSNTGILQFSNDSGNNKILLGFASGTLQPILKVNNGSGQQIGNLTAATADAVGAGQWNHLAFSIDANRQASLYVNGGLVASGSLSAAPFSGSRSSNWVGATGGSNGYLTGAVRDVRVWNSSRPAEQIQASMLATDASGTGLIGSWSLNNAITNTGRTASLLNGATYASTATYGVIIPAESSSAKVRFTPLDDERDESRENVTLTLIGSGRYSTTSNSSSATAQLDDNDLADVVFSLLGSNNSQVVTSDAVVSEGDSSSGNSTTLGLSLAAQPSADVTITLNTGSFSNKELRVYGSPAYAASSVGFGLPNTGFNTDPAFADIDNDGDLDAFIGNLDGNTLFFRNTGSATSPDFSGSSTGFGLPDVGGSASPFFRDIDGDLDLDAFIGNESGSILFFRNAGSRSAAAFGGSSIGFGLPDLGDFANPALVDIDGDGDSDLVTGDWLGRIAFFRNTGSSSVAAFAGSSVGAFGLPLDVGDRAKPTFADIDRDGDLDAFIGNYLGDTLYYKNVGTAQAPAFAGSILGFGLPNVGSIAKPAMVDIDGDTDVDAFIGSSASGYTLFFRNTSSNSSTSLKFTTSNWNVAQSLDLKGVDDAANDGDKTQQVSFQVSSSDSAYVALVPTIAVTTVDDDDFRANETLADDSSGTGPIASFSAPSLSSISEGSSGTSTVTVSLSAASSIATVVYFDLDRGFSDAIDNDVVIRPLSSSGTLAGLTRLQTPSGGSETAVVDTDAINENGSSFRAMGLGPSLSFAGSSVGFGLQADVGDRASIVFADIDADSDLDAFIGNLDGSTLFFRNTGSRSAAAFAGSSISFALPDVGQNASPSFADIDADGDLDAFIGNFDGSTLFFRNTGSSSAAAFGSSSIAFGLPDVGLIAKPTIADIDGDGDFDVFLGNYDGNTLFFRNTGSRSGAAFTGSSSSFGLPDVGQFASPTFRDVDADGDLDAFIGEGTGSTLFFRNTGSSSAAAFGGSSIAFNLPDVGDLATPAIADIDADGDLDAFLSNGAGSPLFFSNTAPASNATWSGWVRIDQSGWYSFETPVQGGVRLTINNERLIDQWFDAQTTWSTPSRYFENGTFVPITLDYLPSNNRESKLALRWNRPVSNGVSTVNELLPAERLQQVDGLHLVIPANSTSAQFSLQAVDDGLAEGQPGTNSRSENLRLNLLDSPAVELKVVSQSATTSGPTQLTIQMSKTYQESVTVPAGTVLNLGPDSTTTANSVARFTLSSAVTLHRDRSATVSGQLQNAADSTAYTGSVLNLVTSYSASATASASPYQVQDPGVYIKAISNWTPSNFAASSSGFGLSNMGFNADPTFADIDGDGDLDAFIGRLDGNTAFFRNTGSATSPAFAGASLGFGLPDVGGSASPSLKDIDRDGDLDAFIGNEAGSILFFRNTGSASAAAFAASSIGFGLPDLGDYVNPTLADIDSDGDFDLVTGDFLGRITFFRNTSSGSDPTFTASSSAAFGLASDVGDRAKVSFADIDGDGDLDAFIGNYQGNTLFFRNTGSTTAPAFAASSLGYGLPDVGVIAKPALVDIDSDGDVDAFIANSDGNTLFFRGSSSVSLALEPTNRSSVTLPIGTVLHYSTIAADGSSNRVLDLTLKAPLTLQAPSGTASTGTAQSAQAQVTNYSGSTAITGLSSVVPIASLAKVAISDNDTPGLLISSDAAGTTPVTTAAVTLSEQGQTVERWIRLTSQPSETVTVYLETGDTSEALLLSSSVTSGVSRLALSFSPDNWSTPQSFRVQPQDDRVDDGDISLAIKTRASSNDPFYDIRSTGVQLNASVADDDAAGVRVGLVSSTIVRGSNGFLTLQLNAQPSSDVSITLTPSDQQFTINDRSIGRPETLVFTPDNWSVVRQVNLRAVDDQAVEDVSRSQLNVSTSSSDPRFQGLSVAPVMIDIVDNDLPSASIQLLNNSTEEAAPGSFRIALSAPAPSSLGSDGVLVNYTINALKLDPGLGYGDFDAFIGNNDGNTIFFQNNGNGNSAAFAGSSIRFGLPDVGALARPAFVDIDADGDLDAFIGNSDGLTLFFRNTGSASSPAFGSSSSGAFGLQADVGNDASPSFVDIDADGDLDAFIGNYQGNTLFFRNTGSAGNAAFAASSSGSFGLPADVGDEAAPTFADIDGDGDRDAFIGNWDGSNGHALFFRNTGSSSAAAFAASSVGAFGLQANIGNWVVPTLIDIDRDGDLDAFIGNSTGNTYFYKNTGTAISPAFAASSVGAYSLSNAGTYSAPTLIDIDGDYPSDTLGKIVQTPLATGQVRIAPGSKTSDAFVVPIDDYFADSTDKQFSVTLSSGSGYQLSPGDPSGTATVTILNNDKAGVAIITSGSRAMATEGNSSGGQFQVVLLSQPSGNVTITLNENGNPTASSTTRQLGDSSAAYGRTLTFTSNDWYIPQVVRVVARDDNKIAGVEETEDPSRPNTGLHTAQLAYSFSSTDPAYNSASHSNDTTYFTNILQTVDVMDRQLPTTTATSIDSSLTSLQEGIESLSLPIVGSLDGKVGSGFRSFLNDLILSIRNVGTPSPSKLKKLLADGIGIAQDHVELAMEGSNVKVSFTFSDEEDIFSIPLAADLGLPALGFKSEGSLDAGYGYDAKVTLVFTPSGEISLDTDPESTYVHANYTTGLSDGFRFTGGLGFLQLEAVNQPTSNETIIEQAGEEVATGLDVGFSLDLGGGVGADGSLTLAELTSPNTSFEELFQYSLSGDAALSLGITTSIGGSAAIPSFGFDLATLLPLFDYSNQEESEAPENSGSIFFDNIRLDLGTYITGMLKPVVDGIDSILNPLYPIVDALYADTHIFSSLELVSTFDQDDDGEVSALDLSQWFANYYAVIDPIKGQKLADTVASTREFLDVVRGVMDLVRNLEAMAEEGSFYVDFGNYELEAFNSGSTDEEDGADQVEVDEASTADLADDTASQADDGGSSEDGNQGSSTFKEVMEQLDELGFRIPLIDDPKNAIQLLLGKDVDLFTWRLPSMGMESEIEQSFPVYPGIEGLIEGGFGVDATIGFGFDTHGLNQWRADGFNPNDAWKVFNGFYVADRNSDDVDIPEFSLDAFMGAGLGLSAVVVKAEMTGGLEAGASFDLMDEGEIAGTDDGKIRGNEILDRITTPLELFELVGNLSAYLKAKVAVGLDMGFYSIWDTVWEEKLATIPIFEFGVGGSYGSGTASNGYIHGATVFWDGNNNGRIDTIEPWTITGDDASFSLPIDHRSFDTDRNGTLDEDEGHLVVLGGVDTSTGHSLEIPMLAPFGQMVTPITTLHTLGLDLGYGAEQLNSWINQSFGLRDFSYLSSDPVLDLSGQSRAIAGGTGAQQTYLAHIKLHFAFDLLLHTLERLAPEQLAHNLPNKLELMSHVAQVLLSQPSGTSINDALANALISAGDNWVASLGEAIDPRLAAIAPAIAEHAAETIRGFGSRLDHVAATYRDSDGPTFLARINAIKTEGFGHFRSALNELARGLHERLAAASSLDTAPSLASLEAIKSGLSSHLEAVRSAYASPPSYKPSYIGPEPQSRELTIATSTIPAVLRATTGKLIKGQAANRLLASPTISNPSKNLQLGATSLGLTMKVRQSSLDHTVSAVVDPRPLLDGLETANQYLTYVAYNNRNPQDLKAKPFGLNPARNRGGSFYDLDQNGRPDAVEIMIKDGGKADQDGVRNGVVTTTSTAGAVSLNPVLSVTSGSASLMVADPSDAASPADTLLKVSLKAGATTVNQIGYVVLKADEADTITTQQLKQRGTILLANLETSDGAAAFAIRAERMVPIRNGQKLVLFEVVDNTLDNLLATGERIEDFGDSFRTLDLVRIDDKLASATSPSGISVELELQKAGHYQGLDDLISSRMGESPILDFRGVSGRLLTGSVSLSREAEHDTSLGFYHIQRTDGAVLDPITNTLITPGMAGYRKAALSSGNLFEGFGTLSVAHGETVTHNIGHFVDAGLIVPYAQVAQTGKTWFPFQDANRDGRNHFRTLGAGSFGIEDSRSGFDQDFEDLVTSFRFELRPTLPV